MRTDGNLVTLSEPAIRHDGTGIHHAEHSALLGEAVQQEGIALVRPLDRHAERLAQRRSTPGVIDVAVRQEDALRMHPSLRDRVQDARHVAARINDDPGAGLLVPEQGTVLL